jgi:hypothetical protein
VYFILFRRHKKKEVIAYRAPVSWVPQINSTELTPRKYYEVRLFTETNLVSTPNSSTMLFNVTHTCGSLIEVSPETMKHDYFAPDYEYTSRDINN